MLWKSDGVLMKTPSTYKLNIEDMDNDSYRSVVNATLIDSVIAKGMLKASFSFDLATEQEAEDLMAETWKNPMNVTIKAPILGGKTISAEFRCSKRTVEMIKTDKEENSTKTKWKCSFNLVQKKKVAGQ